MKKGLKDAIAKALSTSAGEGGDFLPTPLSQEFIGYVRDNNFLRQVFDEQKMSTKTKDIAKILSGTKVYFQSTEGGTAQKSGMKTGTIRLTAKKFMAEVDLSTEVIEDAQEDMEGLIKNDFAESVATAEEESMLQGDPSHATTATESAANDTNWFSKDHRLIFYGLISMSGDISGNFVDDTRAANRVDAGSAEMVTAIARRAKYNLGKFGRKFNDLILILNPWSSNQLLDDPKLVTLEKYGPNATIFTGEFGKLYGKMTVIESAAMTDGYGVITHRRNPVIGDRRMVTIERDKNISEDTVLFVVTSRLDFTVKYKQALCQIYDLDMPDTTS